MDKMCLNTMLTDNPSKIQVWEKVDDIWADCINSTGIKPQTLKDKEELIQM